MGLWYTDTMINEEMNMDMEQMIEYVRQTWFESIMQDRHRLMDIVDRAIDQQISEMSDEEIVDEYKFITGLDG